MNVKKLVEGQILERTLVLLKPDAIERQLTGEILNRFERKGLSIVAAKLVQPDEKLAKSHYQEHKGNEPYYEQMWGHLCSGPNLAIVLEGESAIKASRQLIGNQDPIQGSQIGTIRADFGIKAPKNLVHGSDSYGSAAREIKLWFGEEYLLAPQIQKLEVAPGIFFDYDPMDPMWQHKKKQFMIEQGLVPNSKIKPPKKVIQFPAYHGYEAKVTATPGVVPTWLPPVGKPENPEEQSFAELVLALGDVSIAAEKFAPPAPVQQTTGTAMLEEVLLNGNKALEALQTIVADDKIEGAVPVGALDE